MKKTLETEHGNATFGFWRLGLWMKGLGTYEDIDWLIRRGLLKPYQKLGYITFAVLRGWVKIRRSWLDRKEK